MSRKKSDLFERSELSDFRRMNVKISWYIASLILSNIPIPTKDFQRKSTTHALRYRSRPRGVMGRFKEGHKGACGKPPTPLLIYEAVMSMTRK